MTSTTRRAFLQTSTFGAAAALVPVSLDADSRSTSITSFIATWERAQAYTLALAEAMPEAQYGFRPTDEVRTFAEQMLHIAGANVFFCRTINPRVEAITQDLNPEGKSKADVLQALEASFAHAAAVVGDLNDGEDQEAVQLFNQDVTRLQAAQWMRDHVTHHRGQSIIYLRLQGLAPPQYVGF